MYFNKNRHTASVAARGYVVISIILSVLVLAGLVFLLVCLRGFHQALAHERSRQFTAVRVFMQPVDGIAAENSPEARIIPFPKGKVAFNPFHRNGIIAVTGPQRKSL